jgi:hypothetical protein
LGRTIVTDRLARLRHIFFGLAGLDFIALLLFLGVYLFDRATVTHWVNGSPIYAGLVRRYGPDWAVGYAVASTSVVHVFITLLFGWLAVAIGRGRRGTRIRATVLLVISTMVNVVAATSPVGGLAQLAVMSVSVAVKLATLWLLWAPVPAVGAESRGWR